MKKYLKYTWTVLLGAFFWAILVRIFPKAWSESVVAIGVSFVAFLILIYNLQILVAKTMTIDENRSNIIFAQIVPPVFITVFLLIVGLATNGAAFTSLKFGKLLFNPFVYVFMIIIWGITAGVISSGLNNALNDRGKLEYHRNDKWLGGNKMARAIGSLAIVVILLGSFAGLILSGHAFNGGPDITEKLAKVDSAIIEDKERGRYPYFYGGAYWSYREFEQDAETIHLHPVEEGEEEYCIVILTIRKDINEDFIRKIKKQGEKRETTILLKKCDFSMNRLKRLERSMEYKLEKYVEKDPNSALAREDRVYRYPGIVSIDIEENRVCINLPSKAIERDAKKLFGKPEGLIYRDQSGYDKN